MQIKMVDLSRQYQMIKHEMDAAIQSVCGLYRFHFGYTRQRI